MPNAKVIPGTEVFNGKSTKFILESVIGEPQDRVDEANHNSIESSLLLRESVSLPQLSSDGSLKNRVASLEKALDAHTTLSHITSQNLQAFSHDASQIRSDVKLQIKEGSGKVGDELKAFKQEMYHRFDLQNAENKRLIQHITQLKADNHQLQRDLVLSHPMFQSC